MSCGRRRAPPARAGATRRIAGDRPGLAEVVTVRKGETLPAIARKLSVSADLAEANRSPRPSRRGGPEAHRPARSDGVDGGATERTVPVAEAHASVGQSTPLARRDIEPRQDDLQGPARRHTASVRGNQDDRVAIRYVSLSAKLKAGDRLTVYGLRRPRDVQLAETPELVGAELFPAWTAFKRSWRTTPHGARRFALSRFCLISLAGRSARTRDNPLASGNSVIRGRVVAAATGEVLRSARDASLVQPVFTDNEGASRSPTSQGAATRCRLERPACRDDVRRRAVGAPISIEGRTPSVEGIEVRMPRAVAISAYPRPFGDLSSWRLLAERLVHARGRTDTVMQAATATDDLGGVLARGLPGSHVVRAAPRTRASAAA